MIKFKLTKVGSNGMTFQILDQSDDISSHLPFEYKLLNQRLVMIDSQISLQLVKSYDHIKVYLRGSENVLDDTVSHINYNSVYERNRVYDIVLLAFKELSKSWAK